MKTGACRQPLLLESAGLDRERASAQARILEGMARTMGHTRSASQLAARSVKEPASSSTSGTSKANKKKTVRDNKPCVIFASGSWIASCCYWNVSRPAPGPPPPRYQCWPGLGPDARRAPQKQTTEFNIDIGGAGGWAGNSVGRNLL